ncbi:LysE family translocator [Sphingobium sp. HBC34]|uniref:LysE family translocator n=2 Tax=Sphingobium cyanobacteriorum TaxID=3063954 RepID=A0ABT8ZKB5_9SPHN|nr:LysE family translocator [Sphingobium sp. HBC34]MDO7833981.1 LysE family translocator [Sphingobium sp. HBC34]
MEWRKGTGRSALDLWGFVLAVLLIEITPGPNMAWMAGLAAAEGRRCGMAAVWGVALGLLANALLAALGLSLLLQRAPGLLNGLRYAGAAMMIWLAIDAWRGASRASPSMPAHDGIGRAFITGALINLFNPKAYIFFMVVAPQFMNGAALGVRAAVILSLISVSIATAIHIIIVLAGSGLHQWLASPERTRIVRRLFAIVMLLVAASFVMAGQA